MFRWLWLFGPVVLAAPGCAKLNSDFADADGSEDTTTAGKSTTSGVSGSDTHLSTGGGPSTTEPGTTEPGTTEPGTTHGDSTDEDDESTEGDDDGSTMGSTAGTDGSTGDPTACPAVYGPCNAFAEDSCDTGECRPYGLGGNLAGVACVEQPPTAQPLLLGDPCSHTCADFFGEDACPPRSICDPFSDAPTCVRLCGGSPPDYDCDEETPCQVHDTPNGTFGICAPECDLIDQDCPTGQTCLPNAEGDAPMCFPAPSEGGEQGLPCTVINGCDVGLVCLPSELIGCDEPACCTALCDLESPKGVGCPDGLTCGPYVASAGACQLPE